MILSVEEIEKQIKSFPLDCQSFDKAHYENLLNYAKAIEEKDEIIYCRERDIEHLKEQNRWRDVNEELPEEDDDNILVSDKYGFCLIGNYSKINGFYAEDYKGNEICIKLWRPITPIKKES